MKLHPLLYFISIAGVALITSCSSREIILVSPHDMAKAQNVITARLVWSSACDSFDVCFDTIGNPDHMTRVATVHYTVYNTGRLHFNTSYYWMVRGYKGGQLVAESPVGQFTTGSRSGKPGFSTEYGLVRNGIGYFQNADGSGVKAVDLDTYEPLWKYKFNDIYDVAPMVEQKKDGSWLILEHERANGRVKALYLSDGSTAWESDNNIPYIGGTGFSCYINKAGFFVVLAKGSNGLHALSLENGKELWFAPAQSWYGTIPAVDQVNRLIYSQSFEEIKKIDAETGKVLKSAYTQPDALTTHANTLLVNDKYGYYIATVNWNGYVYDGTIVVYDSSLNVVWKKTRYVERLTSISYHDGLLFSAESGGWYDFLQERMKNKDWKHVTAFHIKDGSVAWDLNLSKYNYKNIHDAQYCNGYVYAITDNTGLPPVPDRFLFRIDASNGKLVEVLDFGFPLSICASPVITDGKLIEAGVVTVIGEGKKTDWHGQYGEMQLNHNAANDSAVMKTTGMHLLNLTR